MSAELAPVLTRDLHVGGRDVASESGRAYPVRDTRQTPLAYAALASRRDARDAVTAARLGAETWSATPANLRGYALHRVSEALHERRVELVEAVAAAEGVPDKRATALVEAALDRWEHHADWADKIGAVLGVGTTEWGGSAAPTHRSRWGWPPGRRRECCPPPRSSPTSAVRPRSATSVGCSSAVPCGGWWTEHRIRSVADRLGRWD